jgi:hypothetical protein
MFETDPKKLAQAMKAGSQALNGLDELARILLELKGAGSAGEVLAEVENGTAALHFSLRMRFTEWALFCHVERTGSTRELTGPRGLCHVHFCRVMMDLVDFARDKVGAYRLQRVQKGTMWLFFDVTIRGQVAQIDAFTARRDRPADRRECLSAGFLHDQRGIRL